MYGSRGYGSQVYGGGTGPRVNLSCRIGAVSGFSPSISIGNTLACRIVSQSAIAAALMVDAVDMSCAIAARSGGVETLSVKKEISCRINAVSSGSGTAAMTGPVSVSCAISAVSGISPSITGNPRRTVPQARDSSRLKPVYLVQLTLKNGGPTLYFSDRNIVVSGQRYESYLHDLSGIAQELKRADSTAMNVNVELGFHNDRISCNGADYGHLIELGAVYPFETALCQIFETYLDGSGNASDTALIFKGVLDCPANIGLMDFTCKVSTMPMYMDARWKQTQLNTVDFPAATDDVGKYVPIVYGSDILMPALRVDWAKTTLIYAVGSNDLSLEITDTTGFAISGQIMIDDEVIGYAGISGRTFTGLTRGASGTAATSHAANADVIPHLSSYDWVLASHPLAAIGDVFAEISGKLWLVTSGITYAMKNGFAVLETSGVITVGAVLDDIEVVDTINLNDGISVSQGSHAHSSSSTSTLIPVSASHYDGGSPAWAGSDVNVGDRSDATCLKVSGTGFSQWGKIQANFASYAGPAPSAVYLCITHQSYTGSPVTVQVSGDNYTWYSIDGSQQKVTQKIYWGTSVPSSMWAYFNNPSGSSVMYMQVFEMWLEVQTSQTGASAAAGVAKQGTVTRSGQASKSGTVIATHSIERLHAVVNGCQDDALGTDTGTPNAVIERPDAVIKHMLEVVSGIFTNGDIDPASFGAAASWYATNGYKLAFCLDKKVKPSEWLSQLARESRSVLSYTAGSWYLNVVPDAAPAPIKTVAKGGLAGKQAMFLFGKTDWRKIANYIVASYNRQYTTIPGKSQSGWLGTVTAQDSASQAAYGVFKKEIQFEAVRLPQVAQSVLNHILLEQKNPTLTVQFDVFWKNFDLVVGDTIQVQNDFFNNSLFFIEEIRRKDAFRATVKAVGWWG